MTVRPIDRFIGAMHRDCGDELLLETGRPVRMLIGGTDRVMGSERVLLAQDVRADQIFTLVRDIVSPEHQRIFEAVGEVSFPYVAPTGKVMVLMKRNERKLNVTISAENPVKKRPPAAAPQAVESALVIESPLETLSTTTPGVVAGAPLARVRPVQAPVRQSHAAPDLDGPMVLRLDSVAPPPPAPPAPPRAQVTPVQPPPPRVKATVASSSSGAQIDRILEILVQQKGSDLHLTSELAPKMRKDGDIQNVPGFRETLNSDTIQSWLMEIAPEHMAQKFEQTNDADYAYEIRGLARFRVNVFRDRRGVGGVMRVIPSEIWTADKLRLPPVVRDLCSIPKGLVVVTGPTGSGKSTTLAAMIDLINKTRSDHIITIEDPVEFVHEPQRCLINQREVHSHTQSFSAALRAALREDPDIVLVGEMRDLETVAIAIETAETGHLVFGTLHTNTAVSTIDRIIDQFPTDRQSQVRVMLSESLKAVIAQTLCKKAGGGRVAALEILLAIPAVANMIREGKTFQIPSIMQTSKAIGMQTLNDALLGLVRDGLIEPQEAYLKAVARADMKAALERAGKKVE